MADFKEEQEVLIQYVVGYAGAMIAHGEVWPVDANVMCEIALDLEALAGLPLDVSFNFDDSSFDVEVDHSAAIVFADAHARAISALLKITDAEDLRTVRLKYLGAKQWRDPTDERLRGAQWPQSVYAIRMRRRDHPEAKHRRLMY